MKQKNKMQRAIDYLEKHWEKGHKDRGNAMVLLALAQIGGREEVVVISHVINFANNSPEQSGEVADGK